tara:strand:- start:14016 stop:14195 length:180 start_codon:yes stop_codon:yes gene_type:complete
MSKIKEHMLPSSLDLKPHHIDAVNLIDKFMEICRDVHQSPLQFENAMHKLYEDARNFGF